MMISVDPEEADPEEGILDSSNDLFDCAGTDATSADVAAHDLAVLFELDFLQVR